MLLVAAVGANPFLGMFAVAVLFIGVPLLWRPGEAPVLLLLFLVQWLQASTKIFHANWEGTDVEDLLSLGGDVSTAIVLSLCSVLSLAVGMRLGAGRRNPLLAAEIVSVGNTAPVANWFVLYLIAFSVAVAARGVAWSLPGLTQPLLGLVASKWAVYWILTYICFSQGSSKRYWLFAFCLEFLFGLGGYFSEFKTVFIFTLSAVIAVPARWTWKRIAALMSFSACLLLIAVLWTSVKSEYRLFVSGGLSEQTVTVSYGEQLNKLFELATDIDGNKLNTALQQLLSRVAYVDYFAVVLKSVPDSFPHENGAIWSDAIVRPFTPRLFFPDKADIDDSERVNQYTGLGVAGREQGASIGLGYIAETYIDFGKAGMLIAIFAFGFVLGRVYRHMLVKPPFRGIIGMGMATSVLLLAAQLETSITKMVGGIAMTLIVSWLVAKFVFPFIAPWLGLVRGAEHTRARAHLRYPPAA